MGALDEGADDHEVRAQTGCSLLTLASMCLAVPASVHGQKGRQASDASGVQTHPDRAGNATRLPALTSGSHRSVRGGARKRRDRPRSLRATYLLQAGRDLRVIQMGVVAALAADELNSLCVRVAAGREPRRGDRGADSGRLGRQPLHATLQARRLRLVSLIGPTRAVRSACASWPWRSTSPSPRLAII